MAGDCQSQGVPQPALRYGLPVSDLSHEVRQNSACKIQNRFQTLGSMLATNSFMASTMTLEDI